LSKPGSYRPTATSPLFGKSVAPKIDNRRSRRSSPVDEYDFDSAPVDNSDYKSSVGKRRRSLPASNSDKVDRGKRGSSTDNYPDYKYDRRRRSPSGNARRRRSPSAYEFDSGRRRKSPPVKNSDYGRRDRKQDSAPPRSKQRVSNYSQTRI
jgi:hypothetical protein